MRTEMHVIASVFVVQDFSISRHEHGNRIGEKQQSSCRRACRPVEPFMANAGIFQFHRIHQMVQRDVGIAATEAREKRSHQAAECHQRIASERAEK